MSAIDGSVAWGISFDANVGADCDAIVASAGQIDVGCDYIGASFGFGGFTVNYAPPLVFALAMIHLVDGPSPTITRAKALQAEASNMVASDVAR